MDNNCIGEYACIADHYPAGASYSKMPYYWRAIDSEGDSVAFGKVVKDDQNKYARLIEWIKPQYFFDVVRIYDRSNGLCVMEIDAA